MTDRHGREIDYRRGCRCELCTRVMVRNQKIRRYRSGLVSTDPLLALFDRLQSQGWSMSEIAWASESSIGHLMEIKRRNRLRVRRSVAERILNTPYEQIGRKPLGLMPAYGAVRRLRALHALGWSFSDLARESGTRRMTLSEMAGDAPERCTVQTHKTIKELYDRLSGTPGTSARAFNHARSKQWPPPLAWDDIDDPEESPEWIRKETKGINVEDAQFLLDLGLGVNEVAERLNVSAKQLKLRLREAS